MADENILWGIAGALGLGFLFLRNEDGEESDGEEDDFEPAGAEEFDDDAPEGEEEEEGDEE